MSRELPQISILVACWNCRSQLAQFLESLTSQSWHDWQLLLLDNASSDGSAELVDGYRQRLACPEQVVWSSQPDGGIYDAWNRGLQLASGDYVCFIGADDVFVDSESLGRMARLIVSQADLITARNVYYSADGRLLRSWGSSWQWKRMRQSMNIAHPAMFLRRDLFTRFGLFDDSFRICGDYEWLLRLPPSLQSIHTTEPILKVVQAGVSHTRIAHVFAETYRAQCRHLGWLPSAGCWLLNWLKYARRRCIGLAS